MVSAIHSGSRLSLFYAGGVSNADGGHDGTPLDFGMLLNLAGIVFLDDLTDRLRSDGFEGFSSRTGWVIRSIGDQPISLRDLAERMGLSSPGTLKAIEPMIKHGYLERARAEDRRVRAVAVTERGREALDAARAFHREFEDGIADLIGEDAARSTRRALESLVSQGSRHVPEILISQMRPQAPQTA